MKTTLLPTTTATPFRAPVAALITVLILAPASAGCSLKSDAREGGEFFKKIFRKDTYTLYRPDIQQGNVIDPAKLARLELGMTKEQVRYLLGNPVADNVFHKDRWNYTYYLIPSSGERRRYRVMLQFRQERLHAVRRSKRLAEPEKEPRKEEEREAQGQPGGAQGRPGDA